MNALRDIFSSYIRRFALVVAAVLALGVAIDPDEVKYRYDPTDIDELTIAEAVVLMLYSKQLVALGGMMATAIITPVMDAPVVMVTDSHSATSVSNTPATTNSRCWCSSCCNSTTNFMNKHFNNYTCTSSYSTMTV